jgi:hypothetical protein
LAGGMTAAKLGILLAERNLPRQIVMRRAAARI